MNKCGHILALPATQTPHHPAIIPSSAPTFSFHHSELSKQILSEASVQRAHPPDPSHGYLLYLQ